MYDQDIDDLMQQMDDIIGSKNGQTNKMASIDHDFKQNTVIQQQTIKSNDHLNTKQQCKNNNENKQKNFLIKSDIDDLLDEIGGGEISHSYDFEKHQQMKTIGLSEQNLQGQTKKKCFPVYLTNGCETLSDKQSCEFIRCTQCDLQVNRFKACKWNNDCDYLFFRNNFKNKKELNKKLEKQIGTTAYACQCSWINIDKLTNINSINNFKWVCSGH